MPIRFRGEITRVRTEKPAYGTGELPVLLVDIFVTAYDIPWYEREWHADIIATEAGVDIGRHRCDFTLWGMGYAENPRTARDRKITLRKPMPARDWTIEVQLHAYASSPVFLHAVPFTILWSGVAEGKIKEIADVVKAELPAMPELVIEEVVRRTLEGTKEVRPATEIIEQKVIEVLGRTSPWLAEEKPEIVVARATEEVKKVTPPPAIPWEEVKKYAPMAIAGVVLLYILARRS